MPKMTKNQLRAELTKLDIEFSANADQNELQEMYDEATDQQKDKPLTGDKPEKKEKKKVVIKSKKAARKQKPQASLLDCFKQMTAKPEPEEETEE